MRALHEPGALAASTWAVCIGAGHFSAHPPDRPAPNSGITDLPAAEREARAVYAALANPDGCAVPKEQLTLLATPHRPPTATEVVTAIDTAARRTPPEGILVIYFAGHAFRNPPGNDGTLYLCGIDAVRSDLPRTAITAEVFANALSPCRARGVLVILDCCVSAGFAEKAPNFFRQGPSKSDFRILLAASRADEPSYELADGSGTLFTKHLVEVLSGRTVVGQAGEIKLVNLVDAVEFGLNEDLRERFHDIPPQRPVVAGWYGRNPTLFVHRGNKAAGRSSEGSLVTRALHKRRLRTTIVGGLLAIAFFSLSYLAVVDQTQYAEADESVVRIYQGHPQWKAPGYPHLLEERALSTIVLKPDSPLRRGLPLIAAPGHSMDALLAEQLNELGAISQLIVDGESSRARARILDAMGAQQPSPETAHFLRLMLAQVATQSDIPKLQELLGATRAEVRNAAMAALIRLSPAMAYPVLTKSLSTNRFDHRALLHELQPSCPHGAITYLTAAADSAEFNGAYATLPDAALRAHCNLERKATTHLISHYPMFQLTDLARYRTESLESPLHLREIDDPYAPLRLALYDAYGREPACMVTLVRMAVDGSRGDLLRQTADLLLLSPACRHSLELSIQSVPEGLELHAMDPGDPRPLFSRVMPNDPATLGEALFEQIVAAYRESRTDATCNSLLNYLASVLKQTDNNHVQALALDAARRIGAPLLPTDNQLNSSDLELRRAAYMALAARDPDRARDALFARSNDGEMEDWPELITRMRLDPSDLSRIRQMAHGGSRERERGAAALAIVGTYADLIDLTALPDLRIRKILSDYLPARTDLAQWMNPSTHAAATVQALTAAGTRRTPRESLYELLHDAQKTRLPIETELASVAPQAHAWRARVILEARSNVWTISFRSELSPGLKLWLTRQADAR